VVQDERSDVTRGVEFLWGRPAEGGSGRRPKIDAAKIITTAIGIADADGLDTVSMQKIAGDLGYAAMSLYRYVPSKALLVDAMSDQAFGTPPRHGRGSWREGVHHWADALWELYRRHPWMLRVPDRTAPTGPNELAWFEALLRPLAAAGLSHPEMVAIATFVSSSVRDLARVASELVPMAFSYGDVLRGVLEGDGFPTLASVIRSGTFDTAGTERDDGLKPVVTLGLDKLMDGIEAGL
jgi:AcrR family transcriptional regulator